MKKVFLFAAICLAAFGLQAQNANNELIKKLVEKQILTEDEAVEIMNETIVVEEKSSTIGYGIEKVKNIFGNTPYASLGGYGLMTYKYSDVADLHNDFRIRVAFLSLNGQLTNNLSYCIFAELVDPSLYEYYITWTPFKHLSFRAGQFKVPFTLENPISLTQLETIYNTRSISSLAGMGDDVQTLLKKRNSTGRDLGMQISGSLLNNGKYDLIEYAMGIFQGAGMNTTDPDNNKDFAGMLLFQPLQGLRVGGGAYFGQATYSINGDQLYLDQHVRNRWVLSSEYKSDRLYARAEWFRGNDAGMQKEGLYGTALYYIKPNKLNLVAKVDYYNKNKEINSEVTDYTVGLNYYFYPKCRLQLNYIYSNFNKKWDASNSNVVAAQMQIVF